MKLIFDCPINSIQIKRIMDTKAILISCSPKNRDKVKTIYPCREIKLHLKEVPLLSDHIRKPMKFNEVMCQCRGFINNQSLKSTIIICPFSYINWKVEEIELNLTAFSNLIHR